MNVWWQHFNIVLLHFNAGGTLSVRIRDETWKPAMSNEQMLVSGIEPVTSCLWETIATSVMVCMMAYCTLYNARTYLSCGRGVCSNLASSRSPRPSQRDSPVILCGLSIRSLLLLLPPRLFPLLTMRHSHQTHTKVLFWCSCSIFGKCVSLTRGVYGRVGYCWM